MVNTQYLEDIIQKSGKKKTYLADKIGCDRSYLYKKINNQKEFKLSEVTILCKELSVNKAERDRIFFA